MQDEFKVHQEARIKSGKYSGLVGVVTETRPSGVRVKIEGVKDSEKINSHAWYKTSQVGRNHAK